VTGQLRAIITATDPDIRNRSVDAWARRASLDELLAECADLDQFRRQSENLYERVRALLFLYDIHRFHLPAKAGRDRSAGLCRSAGYNYLLRRRFEEAIDVVPARAEPR
jgi:hypothetical protein